MSNTRHAEAGCEQRDERYASDPLLCKGLKSGDVIRRCETLDAPEHREIALFLQYVSNLPGALEKLAADLLAAFPERLGTPPMIRFGLKPDAVFNADQVCAVRNDYSLFEDDFPLRGEIQYGPYEFFRTLTTEEENKKREESLSFPSSYPVSVFLEICRENFITKAPALLRQFCIDPAFGIERLNLVTFHDLPDALIEYIDQWEKKTLAGLVVTEVGAKVLEALNYSEDQKCLALVEGFARTGKTFLAKAWCAARPGRRRIVSLSEASSEKEFFREIAKALGAAASYGFKGNELRERVNDILRPGYLTIVIDEAHFLWPQRNLREASPRRIEWVRASLANYGVPVVMIATHQFTKAQQQIEKHTNWSSEQLIGRISFCAKLPDHLEKDDIAAVARFHLPEADARSIAFLVDYVIASKKHLASIDHGVRAARHEAHKAGRSTVTYKDVMIGFNNTVLPSDRNLANAAQGAETGARTRRKGQSKVYALPVLQQPIKTISAPSLERDSGAALIVTPDRKNKRSGHASLSTV
jgi:DNA transposition AAA+ family ATPase